MRIWIGIALVVVIGLIWSVAIMSKWVPVNSAEMKTATVSPHGPSHDSTLVTLVTSEMLTDGLAVYDCSKRAAEVAHVITPSRFSIMKWLRDSLNGMVSLSLRSGCNTDNPSRATDPRPTMNGRLLS
jgi:hypothetical protein